MGESKSNQFQNLLRFLNELRARDVAFRMDQIRDEAILVEVFAPDDHWEVEFMEDGTLDVERFVGEGVMEDVDPLSQLWSSLD